jgi:predicted transposase YbfD/YdcC
LALEILVAVDAELGIVGKVGAELQEERPEVLIDAMGCQRDIAQKVLDKKADYILAPSYSTPI